MYRNKLEDLVDKATIYHLAVENRNIKKLKNAPTDKLLKQDCDGETVLHYAIANNDLEISELLIKKTAKLLFIKCDRGKTPLQLAKDYKEEYESYIKIFNFTLGHYINLGVDIN